MTKKWTFSSSLLSDRRHLLPGASLLRTVRATFTAYGSSSTKAYYVTQQLDRVTFAIHIWSFNTAVQWPWLSSRWVAIECSEGEALTSFEVIICVPPLIKFLKFSCNGRPAGSGLTFVPDIRLYLHITMQPWLSPASMTCTTIGYFRRQLSPRGAIQAYRVPYVTQCHVKCPL